MPGKESDDTQDHLAFGRALKTLRVRAGLTQEELSARVGIGVAYLSRLETATVAPVGTRSCGCCARWM